MRKKTRLFVITTLLFSACLYACDDSNTPNECILPEDSLARCSDGIDNDENGKIDCQEEACKIFDNCKTPETPVPENTESLCNDGIDNDGNQKTDCQEESCKQFDHCKPPVTPVVEDTEELCKDGIDNDNNQKTDCEEDACKKFDHCIEAAEPVPEDSEELCSDGIDNDKNGQKDCRDDSCQGFDFCKDENGNHLKDSAEPDFKTAKECIKHSKCESGFCDSFIGKCSVKCTSNDQCISGFLCRPDGRCAAEAFETVWKTPEPLTKIHFMDPEDTIGECDFVIDWGDGTPKEKWTSCPTPEKQLIHIYANAGEYHIKVTGKMTHWMPTNYHNYDSMGMLYEVISYGPVGIAAEAFKHNYIKTETTPQKEFTHLTSLASTIDIPDSTLLGMNNNGERTLAHMFQESGIKNGVGKWDISNITSLSHTFADALHFSENLNRWDTSKVTDMSYTFGGPMKMPQFNGDVSKWDTSNVTNMRGMFRYATEFRGDITQWDTSEVLDMSLMFSYALNFNGNIGNWKVSKVTNMSSMFDNAIKFNQDLNQWDVSNVTDFNSMFFNYEYRKAKFSIAPKSWNVSSNANINKMFSYTNVSCEDIAELLTKWHRSETPSKLKETCTP